MLRFLGILISVLILSGCSTTSHYQTSINNLQIKVGQLESELDQKDAEISTLRYEVDRLAQQLTKRQEPIVKKQATEEVGLKKEGIVRVSAGTDQIQAALKKAGYYNGSIDGKIGNNTIKAISSFQKDHDLTADGIVGKKTWTMLKSYLE